MNVSLTPELEKFVKNEVDTGLYQTASEVIRAGLRLLKDDKQVQGTTSPNIHKDLEKRLIEGMDRYERGEYLDGEETIRKLYKRIEKTKRARA
jgi:antitoxin ParD1/3/4